MVGYMLLVGSVEPSWFDATHTTPLLTLAITLCSLASTGIVLGQLVRAVLLTLLIAIGLAVPFSSTNTQAL